MEPRLEPRIGLAYGPAARTLLRAGPGLLDFVEIPFEHLRHDPGSLATVDGTPVVLHCASMSIAGFVAPDEATLAEIGTWAERVDTPWIGEHLAFILAGDPEAPTRLTYTMAPQLSEAVLQRVTANLAALRPRFDRPIILENSPQYLDVPGSEMSQVEFIAELARRCDVGLLLDLTHLAVSAVNLGFDPAAALDGLPFDRVVEVHVSGLSVQRGVAWDDHATLPPPLVLDLLATVLDRTTPEAVTLECNWAPDHRHDDLVDLVDGVRALTRGACRA